MPSQLALFPTLPLPDHYDPQSLDGVWRVPYEDRFEEALNWAQLHDIPPSAQDAFKIGLIAIDVQNTFCHPDFELFVAGRSGNAAVEDNRRLCGFLYRNLGRITEITSTLDTHQAMQIFHAVFLVDEEGNHPDPLTQVSARDVAEGRWRANPGVAKSLGHDADYLQRYLEHYTRHLQEIDKFDLTVWPFHSMLGGIGHALVSAVEEVFFFHMAARSRQTNFVIKGHNPLTEAYSAIGPEVLTDHEGREIDSRRDAFLREVQTKDAVIIGGQAKSHCVAWTISDLLDDIRADDESLVEKIYLLEDCTSPVVVPDVVDFTEEAEEAFERFAEAGMHLVRSTDPMENWTGMPDVLSD